MRSLGVILVVVGLLSTRASAAGSDPAAAPADSAGRLAEAAASLEAPQSGGSLRLFGSRDLWYGLACVGTGFVAANNDRWLTEESTEGRSRGRSNLAAAAQPLGSLGIIAPALLAAYGGARLTHRPELASAVGRMGISIGAAGALTFALKEAVGRSRPNESLDDAKRFRPFSGHDSFPSGHTTLAFATAAALDRETSSSWVPWIAYPAAALVGWSRVHDEKHWTSDVVAGAALGIWTVDKVEKLTRASAARHRNVGLLLDAGSRELRAGAAFKF